MNVHNNLPFELQEAPDWVVDIYHSLPALASYKDISAQTQLAKGTIANKCSRKEGPSGGMTVGKKRVFPRLSVALWAWQLVTTDNN